jgi:hypothetical protein
MQIDCKIAISVIDLDFAWTFQARRRFRSAFINANHSSRGCRKNWCLPTGVAVYGFSAKRPVRLLILSNVVKAGVSVVSEEVRVSAAASIVAIYDKGQTTLLCPPIQLHLMRRG